MEKQKEETEQKVVKKKKQISNKELYRLLAFQFQQQGDDGIKISIISNMVANMFYPFTDTQPKKTFKESINNIFRKYNNEENPDLINEQQFCSALDQVDQFITEETTSRFLYKIFKRHDQDKDEELSLSEFRKLVQNFEDASLTEQEIDKIYDEIMAGKDKDSKMDFDTFKSFTSYPKEKL